MNSVPKRGMHVQLPTFFEGGELIMEKEYTRYIYGAGKYGKILLKYLSEIIGVRVDYFVQTDDPNRKEIYGVPVISLKVMLSMETNKLVFIAMNNTKVIKEIERNINNQSSSANITRVFNCRNFISDNLLNMYAGSTFGTRQCVVCGNDVEKFYPWGINEEIFTRHHIVGGGYRESCECPCCGAIDRVRWLKYVLENHTDISRIAGRVLHFAPESAIENYIKRNGQVDYYGADIVQGKAMHVVDITDIPYKDNMFDYVISNHIMEHIVDEGKAVSEIRRVLKENGKWIFSFPICTDMKTYENKAIVSPEKRLEAYGQRDHVRLYGYDSVERFERYGFKIEVYSPKAELDDAQIDKYGFIYDDIIMIAVRD